MLEKLNDSLKVVGTRRLLRAIQAGEIAVAYIAGVKDFHITKMGIPDLPESDRPSKQELREQRAAEKRSRK